ncbi:uncharacterized protein LOC125586942 [Brassica napus]|uniref:uncharacterized protein LOC125586942 n=1 Tax=Brassica napus TaxID=3708 RepID=UPI0020793FAF|nr:uncharacterized protein LOC125586942 [Brassica napus]
MMDLAPPPDSSEPPGEDLVHQGDWADVVKQGIVGGGSKCVNQIWVTAAQDKKQLRKYEVEVSQKDGVIMVEIPEGIVENSTPLWEDFVVGKFLDLAPHVAKVHMVLNKIWKYGDQSTKIEIFEVNPTTMRFKVSSPKAREKIIRRGMWNVVGVPMIVTKWTPTTEEEAQKEEAIPMWVHLEKVPLHMYSWEGLSFITSTVGLPVKPHPETTACTNLNEAKIFVKVDVSKTLPKEITFTKEDKQFMVKFFYPWLPARCKLCDKWGHSEAVCATKGKGKRIRNASGSPSQARVKEGGGSSPVGGVKEAVTAQKSGGIDVEGNCEGVAVGVGNISMEKNSSQRLGIGVAGGTSEWSRVSPAKSGRSLFTLAQEEVVISASKFAVLSVDEPEEGELIEGKLPSVGEVGNAGTEDIDEIESLENDLLDDNILDQQVQEEIKAGSRRGRKPKAPDANPVKSSRPRRKN